MEENDEEEEARAVCSEGAGGRWALRHLAIVMEIGSLIISDDASVFMLRMMMMVVSEA